METGRCSKLLLRQLVIMMKGTGVPVDAVSAALILADKSDVRRSRVRNTDIASLISMTG